jgi:PAS domain S-box-containing protein
MKRILSYLSPPVFSGDEEKTLRSRILYGILLALLGFTLVGPGLTAWVIGANTLLWLLAGGCAALAIFSWLMVLAHRGRVKLAGVLALLIFLVLFILADTASWGLRGPATLGCVLVIVAAGLLLEATGALLFTLAAMAAAVGLYLGENSGVLPFVNSLADAIRPAELGTYLALLAGSGALMYLAAEELCSAMFHARANEKELTERDLELAESEARLRAIFENSRDAIALSVDGIHRMVNHAYLKMFGYENAADLVGRPVTDLDAPAERERVASLMRDRSAGQLVERRHLTRGLRRDGSEFDLEVSASTYEFRGRHHILAILRDVTETKRAEQALRDSEIQYRMLFENSPVPMWIYDRETLAFLAVNDAAVKHYGYSAEEFLRMTIADIRPPEDVPALLENIRRIRGGMDPAGTWRHLKKDGTLIDVEINSHTLDYEGRPAELVLANDITKSLRAYKELQAERAFLREVIDAVPGFIFVKNTTGHFDLVNQAIAAAYGVSVQALTGKTDADFSPTTEEVERFRTDDLRVINTRQLAFIPEEPITFADGSQHWLSTIKVPLVGADGSCTQVLGVCTDITARKQAEMEVLRLNTELEQRVVERTAQLRETIGDLESFSYSISHDLRAPLRVISGFAEILREDASPRLLPEEFSSLEMIAQSAARMSHMIDGLLAFSRLGRQSLKMTRIDSSAIVRSVLEDLAPEMQDRAVDVEISDLPACQGDPDLLRQVWFNLLANAVKFTRGRDPARVWVGCKTNEDGKVVYFVRDNGAGFDMAHASRLFGVFQRLHRAEDFEGTGVGLAIVQRIVRQHGGQIWAESATDQGATFFFTLN